MQNLLLKIIKPTFKHLVHPNCYHTQGPTGVKTATNDASLHEIKVYLLRWLYWWTNTSGTWHKHELLQLFMDNCHDKNIANIAQQMLQQEYITRLRNWSVDNSGVAATVTLAA